MDEKKIQKEAKALLDKFAKALSKVENEKNIDFYLEREEFERSEKSENKCDVKFKEKILKNAPEKDSDFILTERGNWK